MKIQLGASEVAVGVAGLRQRQRRQQRRRRHYSGSDFGPEACKTRSSWPAGTSCIFAGGPDARSQGLFVSDRPSNVAPTLGLFMPSVPCLVSSNVDRNSRMMYSVRKMMDSVITVRGVEGGMGLKMEGLSMPLVQRGGR